MDRRNLQETSPIDPGYAGVAFGRPRGEERSQRRKFRRAAYLDALDGGARSHLQPVGWVLRTRHFESSTTNGGSKRPSLRAQSRAGFTPPRLRPGWMAG